RLNRRLRAPRRLLIRHVRVEIGTAVGRGFVNNATAVEKPVTGTIRLPRRYERGVRPVGDRAQVLLRPGEDVLALGAKSLEVRRGKRAGHVPTVDLAEFAGAGRACEAEVGARSVRHVTHPTPQEI